MMKSGARARGHLFPGPLGSSEASSAAGPRAASSCGRVCGRGGWLPPSLGLLLGGFLVMAAELHLAEDALALHLLLQHLEGLVDIVVTDENLHAAFLFDRAVDGPDGQGARATGHGYAQCGCRWHPRYEPTSIFEIVPADGTRPANWKERRLPYVAVFWAALRTSQCLPVYANNGRAGGKEQ